MNKIGQKWTTQSRYFHLCRAHPRPHFPSWSTWIWCKSCRHQSHQWGAAWKGGPGFCLRPFLPSLKIDSGLIFCCSTACWRQTTQIGVADSILGPSCHVAVTHRMQHGERPAVCLSTGPKNCRNLVESLVSLGTQSERKSGIMWEKFPNRGGGGLNPNSLLTK